MLSLLKDISAKELAARPLRAGTFVLAIALGVALVATMRMATESVVRNFNAQIERVAGSADVQITFGTGETGFPETVVDTVKAQPYVARAIALVRGALSFADGPASSLELVGLDVVDEDAQALYGMKVIERTKDDFTIINDPHGLFVTDKTAMERKLKVGDSLDLASTTGVDRYNVHGIFNGTGLPEAYDGAVAVMYLPAAQQALGMWTADEVSTIHQIDVVLDDSTTPAQAIAKLGDVLPKGLVAAEPEQRQLANRHIVIGLQATLMGISVFALLAAMFIVYSTTAALVTYRTPVLGSLVIAGASPRVLSGLVLLEAAILGLLGGCIGTALGLVMAGFAVEDAAVGLSLNYSLNFVPGHRAFYLSSELLLYPLLGAIAAVVSAYVPARRLRRLDPLELQRVGLAGDDDRRSLVPVVLAASVLAVAGVTTLRGGTRLTSAPLCAAGMALLVVAALLLGLPLVRFSWKQLREPMRGLLEPAGWISIEQLNRNAERSLVTVAAIALSIGVVLAASTLPKSFRASVRHWYGFYGDAVIASRAHQGGWLSAPTGEDHERIIVSVPGVKRVETFRVLQGQQFRGSRVAVAALSDGYIDRALDNASAIAGGDRAAVAHRIRHGGGAAISENLAAHYGLGVGSRVEIQSPHAPLDLEIVAVVPDFVSDKGSILLSRDTVRRNWNDRLVNYFAVFLEPGTTVEAFRSAFARAAGKDAPGSSVLAMAAVVGQIDGAIAAAFADIAALQLLVLVITIAGIVDLAVSNVLDRRRLHAVLRIAGTTDGGVLQTITCEGGLIGVTAGLLGVALGMFASWVWIRFTYPVLVGYVLQLSFAWTNAVVCLVIATATAIGAGTAAGYFRLREPAIDAVRAE